LYELRFVSITILSLHITITYRNHPSTRYTQYQQNLFNRIKGYVEDKVSSLGWKQISDILNSEGLKTPMGKTFKSNHVHSIYKKGKKRLERLNSEVDVKRKVSLRTYSDKECRILF